MKKTEDNCDNVAMLGETLKDLRLSMDLTQTELSDKLKRRFDVTINKSVFSKWETNRERPSLRYLIYLSKFYNVSLDRLLGIEGSVDRTDSKAPVTVSASAPQTIKEKAIQLYDMCLTMNGKDIEIIITLAKMLKERYEEEKK